MSKEEGDFCMKLKKPLKKNNSLKVRAYFAEGSGSGANRSLCVCIPIFNSFCF